MKEKLIKEKNVKWFILDKFNLCIKEKEQWQ